MRRWDRLVDAYVEEYRARGICPASVARMESRLRDWGSWLKGRRPRPVLDAIDPELHVRYLASRSPFRAKTTVYGTLSNMRCFGEYLVCEGVWSANPLRWMKGPKITPRTTHPRRRGVTTCADVVSTLRARRSSRCRGHGSQQSVFHSGLRSAGQRRRSAARCRIAATWSRCRTR